MSAQTPASVSGADLRQTMSSFATGVAVITTESGDKPQGMTVNSLTSVSLDPPLLLVCLVRTARTTEALLARQAFVVNILSKRQDEVANRFARPGANRFEGLSIHRTSGGLPYVPGALGTIECSVEALHPGGDHVIVTARIQRCHTREGTPLVFYRGNYHALGEEGRPAEWYW
jgi:flavin reductase (DIM6/NTAB) family NADH-FMN oxidoreductase RutF